MRRLFNSLHFVGAALRYRQGLPGAMADGPVIQLAASTQGYSIAAMAWGAVQLEPEVEKWLESLPTAQFAHAACYVDLLAEQGPLLGEPYTKQLDRKLRELRFHLGRQAVRITYWIASDRRIILLTVFYKTRMRDEREIDRARRALARCIDEAHQVVGEEG